MQFSEESERDFLSFLKEFSEKFYNEVKGKEVIVFGHRDADGASSVAISLIILKKLGSSAKWALFESFSEAYIQIKKFISSGRRVLAVDIGGLPDPSGRLFIVDHHVIEGDPSDNLLNPRAFDLPGDSYACSSTLLYALARSLGISPKKIVQPAIVGAVGDVQQSEEIGPLPTKRLSGLNERPVREGEKLGIVKELLDLNFYGKRERSLKEAFTIYRPLRVPFLREILSEVIAIDSEERSWEDLSLEERAKIVERIVKASYDMGILNEILPELFIYEYSFPKEEVPILKGSNEFSVLVNGLVRADTGSSSQNVAIKLLLGGRAPELINLALRLHEKAKERRRKFIKIAEERIKIDPEMPSIAYYLETSPSPEIDPALTGSVASILSKKFLDKIVIVGVIRPLYKDLKVSIRFGPLFPASFKAGDLMREVARKMGGDGGGHEASAGCNVPCRGREDLRKFLSHLRDSLSSMLSS